MSVVMPFNDHLGNEKISDKILKDTKRTLEHEHEREFSEDEVLEIAKFLQSLAKISIENYLREESWKAKLAEFPKGYLLSEDGFSCRLCRAGTDVGMWYDKFGLKCMHCQRAIESGLIPGKVVENHELFYTEYELERFFKLYAKVLTHWIRYGIIKVRIIPKFDRPSVKHFRIFLLADNAGFLPPKELIEVGQTTECEVDGEIVQKHLEWFQCFDPFEYLKEYGIMNYMLKIEHAYDAKEVVEKIPVTEFCKPVSFSGRLVNCKVPEKIKRRAKRKDKD